MKRTSKALIWAIILIGILLILFYFLYWRQNMVKLSFKESSQSVINPNRGFYAQIDTKDHWILEQYYTGEEEFRMILLGINLIKDRNNETISKEKIEEVVQVLTECRRLGMSVVVRAAYHFWNDDYEQPDSFKTILGHVGQLSEILNDYKDVILGVQAGFIGPYGEWHTSKYMEKDADGIPYPIKLLQELLLRLDEEIIINVRRPMFIRKALEYGLPIDRFGIHNDALLSTDTDMGTYVEEGYDRKAELLWIQENIITQINGGEMTNVSEYTKIENAVSEFYKMNLTYLNRYYNTEVLDSWREQTYGGMDGYTYIKEHLGYRLSLAYVKIPATMVPGQELSIIAELRNTGFAKPEKPYTPYLVLRKDGQTEYYPLEGDFTKKDRVSMIGEVKPYSLFSKELSDRIELGIKLGKENSIHLANEGFDTSEGCYWFAAYSYDSKNRRYSLER